MTDNFPPFPDGVGAEIRHIPDFPGYAVTADGRVLSCRIPGRWQPRYDDRWRELSLHPKTAYLGISLWKNNTAHQFYVHRLVAEIFIEPNPGGLEVCHLNGNEFDNRVKNLEWVSHSENEFQKRSHGTAQIGQRNGGAKLTNGQVYEIRVLAAAGEIQHKIAAKFGVSQAVISRIHTRKRWSHL